MNTTTCLSIYIFFFFNDTATTEIYTLSLHDALPICHTGALPRADMGRGRPPDGGDRARRRVGRTGSDRTQDRKSTRLNSSHGYISYAVFCLKKKNDKNNLRRHGSTVCIYYARCPASQ